MPQQVTYGLLITDLRNFVAQKMYSLLKTLRKESKLAQVRRIANNILKSFDMMWLFVDHEHIEPTNNFAERQIKHHVKYRKNVSVQARGLKCNSHSAI